MSNLDTSGYEPLVGGHEQSFTPNEEEKKTGFETDERATVPSQATPIQPTVPYANTPGTSAR